MKWLHKKKNYERTVPERVPIIGTGLFGVLGHYWVPIYISGSLFSVFWLHSCKGCQFTLHVIQQWVNLIMINLWWVIPCTVIIQMCCTVIRILIFSYAYALNFINRCFVPYFGCWGSLLGPYFKKVGSPLVSGTVQTMVPLKFNLLREGFPVHSFPKYRHCLN